MKWRARGTKNFLASSTMRKEKMIVTPSAKLEEEEEEEGEEEISMLNIRMSRTPIEGSPVPGEEEGKEERKGKKAGADLSGDFAHTTFAAAAKRRA
jgi:hypothetical protein